MSESKCPFCNMTETFRASLEGAESMKVRRAAEFVGQPATYRVMLTRFQEILVCAEHAVGIQRPKHPAPQADANDVPCDGSRFAPDTSLQRCQLPHGHSGPHQYHPTPQAEHTPEPWYVGKWNASEECIRIHADDKDGGDCWTILRTVDPLIAKDKRAEHEANAERIVACVNALSGIADPSAVLKEVREALRRAEQFIQNGVEFGYIRLPDKPDPALQTLPLIQSALAKLGRGA